MPGSLNVHAKPAPVPAGLDRPRRPSTHNDENSSAYETLREQLLNVLCEPDPLYTVDKARDYLRLRRRKGSHTSSTTSAGGGGSSSSAAELLQDAGEEAAHVGGLEKALKKAQMLILGAMLPGADEGEIMLSSIGPGLAGDRQDLEMVVSNVLRDLEMPSPMGAGPDDSCWSEMNRTGGTASMIANRSSIGTGAGGGVKKKRP